MLSNEVPPQPATLPPDLKTIEDSRGKEYEAFLKYVAQSTGALTYQQLAILWPAISQASMEWLLHEKRSVDLGYAILHPRPHRANWKEIMVATFPRLGPTLLGRTRAVKDALLEGLGYNTKLLDSSMLAIGSDRYVMWGIDIELKRSWWRAMYRHEAFKLSRLGSVGYARHVARAIIDLQPKIVAAYLSYLRQVAYPCARVKNRTIGGFLVPFVPRGKVRAKADDNLPVSVVVPRNASPPPSEERPSLGVTDAGVPPVHHLRPDAEDLRLTGDKLCAGGE